MKSRDDMINDLLLKEMASKSLPPAITFASFAIIVFFYQFNIEIYKLPLQIACVGVVLASILRFYIARSDPEGNEPKKYWRLIKISVWFNTFCWAIIFGLASWELQAASIHYVVAMVMLTSFVTASLFTLSYNKWLFFPFQILLLVPQALLLIYLGMNQNAYYVLAFVFIVAIAYQIKQYVEYRRLIMYRFGYQIDLENSYSALKEQTVKLVQVSKSAALGEMAGGLSHEVNNSLMIILGSLQQMERNMKKAHDLTPDNEIKVQKMVNAILKIKTVVDGLRYYSRQMDSGPREEADLEDIINRTLNFSYEMVKAHNIDFQITEIPKVKVYCHPIQITQILFNMIKNAYDALEKVTSHRFIKLSFEMKGDKIQIKLCNSGPKIKQEVSSRIFQPFFTTKDVNEGTGLSLSIALGIAREHQGNLYLDEGTENTTFILELPCRKVIT